MSLAFTELAQAFTGLMPEKPALPEPEPESDDSSPDEAPPAPEPPAPPYFEKLDYAVKGAHLDATILPDEVVSVARLLDEHGFAIDFVTGVDWIAEEQMEVIYDFFHYTEPWRVVARTRIPRAQPELPSILEVFPGANWHERETHEFLGIRFLGHPNLTPFLLPEDAAFHPLRKDFKP